MKLYIHRGAGHWTGSKIIVWAGSRKTAEKLVRETLDEHRLPEEVLDVEELMELGKQPVIIHVDDGDE